ncbi:MAG TPA: transposase, partial [Cycloclasticus sp.]|nr:transposase [Cycloclasticus sp.]
MPTSNGFVIGLRRKGLIGRPCSGKVSVVWTGLDIAESVPDHSTFWRFRQTLEKLCLMDGLLT